MVTRLSGFAVILFLGGFLSGCASPAPQAVPRWDAYYARAASMRASVQVVPPEGTTVPMGKLIAEYVVENLKKEEISAQLAAVGPRSERSFVLSGVAEPYVGDRRVNYRRILRWILSDTNGRVISTYALGIEGTDQDWDFGSPRVLSSIGMGTAGPVAQMVRRETRATTPLDPLRAGLLVEQVTGLGAAQARILTRGVARALRTSDVLVTGDPRQATFRLAGEVTVEGAQNGFEKVRIVWRVLTMDRRELGRAMQENDLPAGTIDTARAGVVDNARLGVVDKVRLGAGGTGRWAAAVPSISKAAAVGIEYVFGTRPGPPPGSARRARGAPPPIALPGEPGRALPPPQ